MSLLPIRWWFPLLCWLLLSDLPSLSTAQATPSPSPSLPSLSPSIHYNELVTSVYRYHLQVDQGDFNASSSSSSAPPPPSDAANGRSRLYLDAELHLTLIGYERSVDSLDDGARSDLADGRVNADGVDGVEDRVYILELQLFNTEAYSLDAGQRRQAVDVSALLHLNSSGEVSLQSQLSLPFYFLQSRRGLVLEVVYPAEEVGGIAEFKKGITSMLHLDLQAMDVSELDRHVHVASNVSGEDMGGLYTARYHSELTSSGRVLVKTRHYRQHGLMNASLADPDSLHRSSNTTVSFDDSNRVLRATQQERVVMLKAGKAGKGSGGHRNADGRLVHNLGSASERHERYAGRGERDAGGAYHRTDIPQPAMESNMRADLVKVRDLVRPASSHAFRPSPNRRLLTTGSGVLESGTAHEELAARHERPMRRASLRADTRSASYSLTVRAVQRTVAEVRTRSVAQSSPFVTLDSTEVDRRLDALCAPLGGEANDTLSAALDEAAQVALMYALADVHHAAGVHAATGSTSEMSSASRTLQLLVCPSAPSLPAADRVANVSLKALVELMAAFVTQRVGDCVMRGHTAPLLSAGPSTVSWALFHGAVVRGWVEQEQVRVAVLSAMSRCSSAAAQCSVHRLMADVVRQVSDHRDAHHRMVGGVGPLPTPTSHFLYPTACSDSQRQLTRHFKSLSIALSEVRAPTPGLLTSVVSLCNGLMMQHSELSYLDRLFDAEWHHPDTHQMERTQHLTLRSMRSALTLAHAVLVARVGLCLRSSSEDAFCSTHRSEYEALAEWAVAELLQHLSVAVAGDDDELIRLYVLAMGNLHSTAAAYDSLIHLLDHSSPHVRAAVLHALKAYAEPVTEGEDERQPMTAFLVDALHINDLEAALLTRYVKEADPILRGHVHQLLAQHHEELASMAVELRAGLQQQAAGHIPTAESPSAFNASLGSGSGGGLRRRLLTVSSQFRPLFRLGSLARAQPLLRDTDTSTCGDEGKRSYDKTTGSGVMAAALHADASYVFSPTEFSAHALAYLDVSAFGYSANLLDGQALASVRIVPASPTQSDEDDDDDGDCDDDSILECFSDCDSKDDCDSGDGDDDDDSDDGSNDDDDDDGDDGDSCDSDDDDDDDDDDDGDDDDGGDDDGDDGGDDFGFQGLVMGINSSSAPTSRGHRHLRTLSMMVKRQGARSKLSRSPSTLRLGGLFDAVSKQLQCAHQVSSYRSACQQLISNCTDEGRVWKNMCEQRNGCKSPCGKCLAQCSDDSYVLNAKGVCVPPSQTSSAPADSDMDTAATAASRSQHIMRTLSRHMTRSRHVSAYLSSPTKARFSLLSMSHDGVAPTLMDPALLYSVVNSTLNASHQALVGDDEEMLTVILKVYAHFSIIGQTLLDESWHKKWSVPIVVNQTEDCEMALTMPPVTPVVAWHIDIPIFEGFIFIGPIPLGYDMGLRAYLNLNTIFTVTFCVWQEDPQGNDKNHPLVLGGAGVSAGVDFYASAFIDLFIIQGGIELLVNLFQIDVDAFLASDICGTCAEIRPGWAALSGSLRAFIAFPDFYFIGIRYSRNYWTIWAWGALAHGTFGGLEWCFGASHIFGSGLPVPKLAAAWPLNNHLDALQDGQPSLNLDFGGLFGASTLSDSVQSVLQTAANTGVRLLSAVSSLGTDYTVGGDFRFAAAYLASGQVQVILDPFEGLNLDCHQRMFLYLQDGALYWAGQPVNPPKGIKMQVSSLAIEFSLIIAFSLTPGKPVMSLYYQDAATGAGGTVALSNTGLLAAGAGRAGGFRRLPVRAEPRLHAHGRRGVVPRDRLHG